MNLSKYIKVTSPMMFLLFIHTFGFAVGDKTKWVVSPSIVATQGLVNEEVHLRVDTVFNSKRPVLHPILPSGIEVTKNQNNDSNLKLSMYREISPLISKNSTIPASAEKNGVYGAQMRNGRGYREMRGFREMGSDGQFFEDSENVTEMTGFRVFPNPAKDWVIINLPAELGVRQILLCDMTGTVVKEWTSVHYYIEHGSIRVNTESISPGTYTLNIIAGDIAVKPIRILIRK